MTARIDRRALAAGLLATATAPASTATALSPLRDDGKRLPDHAALWSALPLPFTPAQAWHRLSPATQAEIGAAVMSHFWRHPEPSWTIAHES